MDFDNLFILLIIFSFIARVIGDAMKRKKGPDEQQGRPPLRRLPQQQVPQQPLPQQQPGRGSIEGGARQPQLPRVDTRTTQAPPERAADMIPAELWEVLTGQRRAPLPVPAPRPLPDEADDDEELIPDEESLLIPETSYEDSDVADLLRRRKEVATRRARGADRGEPIIVSLETDPLPTAARHAAFHRKFDPQAPARVLRRGPPVGGLARIAGTEPDALRRAIILQEILGKPKGLE